MTNRPLTARQSEALEALRAIDGLAIVVPCGTARYPKYSLNPYTDDEQLVVPDTDEGRAALFVYKSIFNALVTKGALVQIARANGSTAYRVNR